MEENFNFYLLRVDNILASIMVNLAVKHLVPWTHKPYMGYVRLYMNQPREDGLSSQEEFERLSEVGDAIESSVSGKEDDHLYVGRNTTAGFRDFVFYSSDLENLHNCLETNLRNFPEYKYEVGGREDGDSSVYLNFLHPNKSQMQQIMDRGVCDRLKELGDDHSIEREIDHRVYFSNKQALKAFNSGRTKPIFGEQYLDFKSMGTPLSISDVVYDIVKKCEEIGGEYDGWGCEVQKSE